MKITNVPILFAFTISAIATSCCYPKATLKSEKATNGEIALRIDYPSPKMSSYDFALKENKWAILFNINDSTSISFPPPGSILDNRWFYYLGLFDQDLNPIWKNPILFDEHKTTQQNYSGQASGIFPTNRGLLVVYCIGNSFFYSEFDLNGNKLGGKIKFYEGKINTTDANRILSIDYHDENIYLFLVEEPENLYSENWNLQLIRHNPVTNKTEFRKNFIQIESGWYYSKSLSVNFSEKSMQLIWADGVKEKYGESFYKLSSTIIFADCNYMEKQCTDFRRILKTKNYEDTNVRFFLNGKVNSVVVQEKTNFFVWKIDENGKPEKSFLIADEKMDSLYSNAFKNPKGFPYKVIIGTGK